MPIVKFAMWGKSVQNGNPSPTNPVPIEVTDKPVTVTIKGGTEQQSVILASPRPLTKWDKLEKVDGVWQWVYQSKKCMLTEIATIWQEWKSPKTNQYYFEYKSVYSEGNVIGAYSDCFRGIPIANRDENFNTIYTGANSICFNTDVNKYPTLQSWIEWVNANPVNILYKTKELEYIPLPQHEQEQLNALTMYAGTTEITNNGGCTMELTYTVDTKSYVDKKIAEISGAVIAQKGA